MTDQTAKSTTNVWQRLKEALGLQYGMPFIDGPDEEVQGELFPPEFPMPPFLDLSTAAFGYDPGFDLGGVYELPQSTLEQLVLGGKIMSVTTFDEHMHPDVHWIAPAEFGAAFDDLIRGEKTMTEAAYTELKPAYPGYVNLQLSTTPTTSDPLAQREGDPDTVIITMRGSPIEGRNADDLPTITAAPTGVLTMAIEAWDQLMTEFNRMRAGVPQKADAPMPMGKPE